MDTTDTSVRVAMGVLAALWWIVFLWLLGDSGSGLRLAVEVSVCGLGGLLWGTVWAYSAGRAKEAGPVALCLTGLLFGLVGFGVGVGVTEIAINMLDESHGLTYGVCLCTVAPFAGRQMYEITRKIGLAIGVGVVAGAALLPVSSVLSRFLDNL